jgi:hypothetical protein
MKISKKELKLVIKEVLEEINAGDLDVSPATLAGATPPAQKPGKAEHISGVAPTAQQKQNQPPAKAPPAAAATSANSNVFAKALLDLLNKKGSLNNAATRQKMIADLGISPEEIDMAINKVMVKESKLGKTIQKMIIETLKEMLDQSGKK